MLCQIWKRYPLKSWEGNSLTPTYDDNYGDHVRQPKLKCPNAAIVKKETEKGMDVGPKSEDRRLKFVESAYRTGARSASTSDWPPLKIYDELTNKKAYYLMS